MVVLVAILFEERLRDAPIPLVQEQYQEVVKANPHKDSKATVASQCVGVLLKAGNMTLPSLDLSLYTHGDAGQRQKFASELLGSLTDHGFVKLVKHGISDQRIRELFRWVSSWLPRYHVKVIRAASIVRP